MAFGRRNVVGFQGSASAPPLHGQGGRDRSAPFCGQPIPIRSHRSLVGLSQAQLAQATTHITLDRYGHLMPGNEEEAADMLDADLARANTESRIAQLA
jgi:hypothetical protein